MTQTSFKQALIANVVRDTSGSILDQINGTFDISRFSDAELLALFIGGPKASRIDAATKALSEHNGLAGLLQLCLRQSNDNLPLSRKSCQLIQAAIELAQRSILRTLKGTDVLSSPEHVRQFLSLHLTGREHEVFAILFLDNRHRVVKYHEMFRGTIDSAAVYPREIVKSCLSYNAAACILAHNHPSGVAEPSDTDVRLTRRLVDACSLIDVRILDHLIIGQGVQTSLAERGLM